MQSQTPATLQYVYNSFRPGGGFMRFYTTVFSLFLIININSSYAASTEIYFSPNGRCESRVVDLIDRSKKSLKIIVYALNNEAIVNALFVANKRGVRVQILTDRLQASGRSSRALDLHQAKLDLKVHSIYKIEHNKFAISDDTVLETGSFNWTNPAQSSNSENCMFFTQKHIIKPFLKRFYELWELNTYEASEATIKRIIERRKERDAPELMGSK
jgi:phosphatidylserine/phosphatidylglycerophosphate/cardiolipin synthase-like enzyme